VKFSLWRPFENSTLVLHCNGVDRAVIDLAPNGYLLRAISSQGIQVPFSIETLLNVDCLPVGYLNNISCNSKKFNL